jgi:hypothetical protein
MNKKSMEDFYQKFVANTAVWYEGYEQTDEAADKIFDAYCDKFEDEFGREPTDAEKEWLYEQVHAGVF